MWRAYAKKGCHFLVQWERDSHGEFMNFRWYAMECSNDKQNRNKGAHTNPFRRKSQPLNNE